MVEEQKEPARGLAHSGSERQVHPGQRQRQDRRHMVVEAEQGLPVVEAKGRELVRRRRSWGPHGALTAGQRQLAPARDNDFQNER